MNFQTAISQMSSVQPLATRPHPLGSTEDFPAIPGRVAHFGRDEEIYAEGSPTENVYRVISGAVRTSKLMADGRRHIGEFALPGDLFGLDGIDEHFYAAEAVADTQVQCFSRRRLEELATSDPSAARAVRRLMQTGLAVAQQRIVSLGRKTALERVVSFLLEMAERASDGSGRIVLPMSRYDIADHLGLTVETVSRSLGNLKQRHWITLEEAHRVRLLHRRALQEASGDDAVTTH